MYWRKIIPKIVDITARFSLFVCDRTFNSCEVLLAIVFFWCPPFPINSNPFYRDIFGRWSYIKSIYVHIYIRSVQMRISKICKLNEFLIGIAYRRRGGESTGVVRRIDLITRSKRKKLSFVFRVVQNNAQTRKCIICIWCNFICNVFALVCLFKQYSIFMIEWRIGLWTNLRVSIHSLHSGKWIIN